MSQPGDDDAARSEQIRTPLENFDGVMRYLRAIDAPCLPPVGVGGFEVLYASAREVAVWYTPAREEQHAGEVVIPADWLEAGWNVLLAGETLSEDVALRLAAHAAGGRWLLAVLAQLPGVDSCAEPLALRLARQTGSGPDERQGERGGERGGER